MLSKDKLDNLWQSGFCKTLIERVRYSEDGVSGSEIRLQLVEDHLKEGCQNCRFANMMRDVEMRTAHAMGPQAVDLYKRGGELRRLPGFAPAFKQVFDTGVACERIDPRVTAWIVTMVAQRAGKPYPYTEESDAEKTN